MALSSVPFMGSSMKLNGIQLGLNCNGLAFCTLSYRASIAGSKRTRRAQPCVVKRINVADGVVAGGHGGSIGGMDSFETVQGSDSCNLKPAEEHHVDNSFKRIGFIVGCAVALGLHGFDSGVAAAAAELDSTSSHSLSTEMMLPRLVSIIGDLDPGTAQLATSLAGPFINIFNILFIVRIVMSWYPGIPVKKFPFFLAYNPTEPVLGPTRKVIPPVGGVDVAPVIWVAIMSFANEVLLGKQGLLVLLSQQQP
ncbi:unnamed protein product [Calypogeia fissa]